MKNKYLENKEKKYCNGCGICANICPVNAIKMVEDKEGFLYPEIDNEKCINCQKCKNICSHFNIKNTYKEKVYASYTTNEIELKECSSGGMFYILVKYVIENNGVVFGVKFNEQLKAEHDYAETLEECKKFRGSKYVRSDIKDSYYKVKEFLDNGRMVLFTGTPCQCNALKIYLGKKYENLIICDIVCHANPSPKVFEKYIKELKKIKTKKVQNIYFRSKENGWKNQTPIIEYEDKEKEEEYTYFYAFVRELIGRPSCHSCPFASPNRISDFTIGDLWGLENMNLTIEMKDGVSLFTVNSEKAEKIFEIIKKYIIAEEIERDKAYSYNHYKNVLPHKNRQKFFNKIDNSKSIIQLMKKYSKDSIIKRGKNKLKNIARNIIK